VRKSILSSFGLALGLSLALSACDVSALPYAAKVGNATVSTAQLEETLSQTASNAELRCVQKNTAVDGTGGGDFAASLTAVRLGELVQLQLEASLLSSLHLHLSAYATTAAVDELVAGFSSSPFASCASSGPAFLAMLPGSYRQAFVDLQAYPVVLEAHLAGAELSDAGIARYEQRHRAEMTLTCLSAIVVATKASAESLARAIRAGANFASLAKAHSLDTGSAPQGGALGCAVPGDLEQPVGGAAAALAVGQLSAPVPFDGSYVLLLATSRGGLASTAEALQAILNSESNAETSLVKRYSATIGVEINPSYGAYSLGNSGAEVVPPVGPSDAQLANPSAVTPLNGG
jgi:parvulin-like peptidyl-prolyl isomerase